MPTAPVAVAVTRRLTGTDVLGTSSKGTLALALAVTFLCPMYFFPSLKPEGSDAGLEKNWMVKVLLGVELRPPVMVVETRYTGPVRWRSWDRDTRRIGVSEESEGRSFWDRLLSPTHSFEREKRVVEYIIHRLGDGATLGEVVQEEYVRRNASPVEVEEILQNPRLVTAAREHMERDFDSGELDPHRRPG